MSEAATGEDRKETSLARSALEARATDPGAPLVSLVAPVHDEEESLGELVRRAAAALADLGPFEIVLVDDGSNDGSLERMRALEGEHPEVRALSMGSRSGQSAAVWAGVAAARAAVIATIDADLQQDPADLPGMITALNSCNAVVGYRARRRDSLMRRGASRIANRVRNAALGGPTFRDSGCSLRVVERRLMRALVPFDGMHRFLPTLLAQRGAAVVEVPVAHAPRASGRSKYGILSRGARGALDVLAVRWMRTRLIP